MARENGLGGGRGIDKKILSKEMVVEFG